jgi:2-desacetyl-2-hydroxyethyl bacteriochlorophyllide A dehydrogenase
MKAARFYGVGEPLSVEEIPVPKPGGGEVLVKVKACGICGSDIHIVYEGSTPTAFQPITIGHEFSGEIAEMGEAVGGWERGARVAVSCIVSCGVCLSCLSGNQQICSNRKTLGVHYNGGLAEYAIVPSGNIAKLTDTIPFDQGAILTDAVATPYHAMTRRAKMVGGESVAVVGCGGLGIHAVQLAKLFGASMVIAIDTSDAALDRARTRGADWVFRADKDNPVSRVKEVTRGLGVDMSLECVGQRKSIELAISCLRPGGRAVVVGLGGEKITTLPPNEFVRGEYELRGSYAFTVREIEEIIQLVTNGRLDLASSITRRISLDEINEGLEALYKKEGDPIRIVVMM